MMDTSLTVALRRTFIPNSHLYIPMPFFSSPPSSSLYSSPPASAAFRRRKGGLEPSAVNSLPLVAYGEGAKQQIIGDCAICLSEFEERECVKLIPYCGHVFHSICIDAWLSAHVTCPLCRHSQLFNEAPAPL